MYQLRLSQLEHRNSAINFAERLRQFQKCAFLLFYEYYITFILLYLLHKNVVYFW